MTQSTGGRCGPGFSLIEVMVALALSSLVIALLVQALSGVRHSVALIDQLSEVQEQGLLASTLLAEAIAVSTSSVLCAGQPSWRVHFNHRSAQAAWTQQLLPLRAAPAALNVVRRPDSDVLLLRHPEPQPPLTITAGAIDNPVLSTQRHALRQCDLLLISDCTHSEVFQNQSDGSFALSRAGSACSPGNRTLPWRQDWLGAVQVVRLEWAAWYIRADTDGELALYRTRLVRGSTRNTAAEVRGIEQLKVQYGVSVDGQQVNAWLTADAVSDWRRVVAVRVAVVARSQPLGRPAEDEHALPLWGETLEVPNDGRVRRVFTRTVALHEPWRGAW
jgi:type IV pilus assembly protein PilW